MSNKMRKQVARFGFIGVVLLLVAIAWMAFSVKEIGVFGNTIHTAEEIQEGLTQGFLEHNSLYLAWKYRKGEIPETLPYLKEINIQLDSPSHLTVQVSEKEPVGYIEKDGFIYFDADGTVLEIAPNKPFLCTEITGVEIDEPVLYQKLPSQSSAQLRTILSLIQLLKDHELDCGKISFNENSDITVYIDKVEAQMGQDEYLEEKVANLNKIMEKLDGQKGVLHLENFTGKNETVSFSPADETEDFSNLENSDITVETEAPAPDEEAGEEYVDPYPEHPQEEEGEEEAVSSSTVIPMVFNSSGTLIYNVHVEGGIVVDSYGNPVDGCYVNEEGNVVDAYMNQFDPQTGENIY